jgi:hypothetical protein
VTKFADTKPWETTTQSGRADLRLHPLIREAYKVACLIEDCGGSPELTLASTTAFALTEKLSDYFRETEHPQTHEQAKAAIAAALRRIQIVADEYGYDTSEWLTDEPDLDESQADGGSEHG